MLDGNEQKLTRCVNSIRNTVATIKNAYHKNKPINISLPESVIECTETIDSIYLEEGNDPKLMNLSNIIFKLLMEIKPFWKYDNRTNPVSELLDGKHLITESRIQLILHNNNSASENYSFLNSAIEKLADILCQVVYKAEIEVYLKSVLLSFLEREYIELVAIVLDDSNYNKIAEFIGTDSAYDRKVSNIPENVQNQYYASLYCTDMDSQQRIQLFKTRLEAIKAKCEFVNNHSDFLSLIKSDKESVKTLTQWDYNRLSQSMTEDDKTCYLDLLQIAGRIAQSLPDAQHSQSVFFKDLKKKIIDHLHKLYHQFFVHHFSERSSRQVSHFWTTMLKKGAASGGLLDMQTNVILQQNIWGHTHTRHYIATFILKEQAPSVRYNLEVENPLLDLVQNNHDINKYTFDCLLYNAMRVGENISMINQALDYLNQQYLLYVDKNGIFTSEDSTDEADLFGANKQEAAQQLPENLELDSIVNKMEKLLQIAIKYASDNQPYYTSQLSDSLPTLRQKVETYEIDHLQKHCNKLQGIERELTKMANEYHTFT